MATMFSRPGRIFAALLTLAAAVLIAAAISSHDSLAGVAVLFLALIYVGAMVVLLICDFVATSLLRSRRTIRRADGVNV